MKDIKLKDKIAQGINDLFYIWKREVQTTFRDHIPLSAVNISGKWTPHRTFKSSLTVLIWKKLNRC